jgi:hypothetical protein
MNRKHVIDWVKMGTIVAALGMLAGLVVWSWNHAFAASLDNLPTTVSQNTKDIGNLDERVSSLEIAEVTNVLIINNHFDLEDQEIIAQRKFLVWIEKRLNGGQTNGIEQ